MLGYFCTNCCLICLSNSPNTTSQYLWLTEHLQTKYYHLIPEVNDWKPVYGYCALLMTMNARCTYFQLVTISSFTYRMEYVWIIKKSHGVVDNNIYDSNSMRSIFVSYMLLRCSICILKRIDQNCAMIIIYFDRVLQRLFLKNRVLHILYN